MIERDTEMGRGRRERVLVMIKLFTCHLRLYIPSSNEPRACSVPRLVCVNGAGRYPRVSLETWKTKKYSSLHCRC